MIIETTAENDAVKKALAQNLLTKINNQKVNESQIKKIPLSLIKFPARYWQSFAKNWNMIFDFAFEDSPTTTTSTAPPPPDRTNKTNSFTGFVFSHCYIRFSVCGASNSRVKHKDFHSFSVLHSRFGFFPPFFWERESEILHIVWSTLPECGLSLLFEWFLLVLLMMTLLLLLLLLLLLFSIFSALFFMFSQKDEKKRINV